MAAPTPSTTPIARLNTAQMVLPRIDFCSLVGDATVSEVLSAKTWKARGWDNGEHAPLTADTDDVAAEHLCEWASEDGSATARAWIFSRPVDRKFARSVVRAERRTQGCATPQVPDFGKPSVLQVCAGPDQNRVRRAGLFADTWFACELSAQADLASVRERTDAWCSELVSQLNTTN